MMPWATSLELEDLQTFVQIADAGGVSAAARRMGMSKSIISRRLQRLEEDVGTQLITRTTRGASLTEAGLIFRQHAFRACAEMDIALESVLTGDELRGRLRVAAPLTIGTIQIADAMADFARLHARVDLHTCYSDRCVDLVTEGFDGALRIGHLSDSNLVARKVACIETCLVASPAYIAKWGSPESPDELMMREALLQSTEPWHLVDGRKIITIHPRGHFKADSSAALLAAAIAGLGIARLCTDLFEQYQSGELVRVMTRFPCAPTDAHVIRPRSQYSARKVHALTDFLIEYFALSATRRR